MITDYLQKAISAFCRKSKDSSPGGHFVSQKLENFTFRNIDLQVLPENFLPSSGHVKRIPLAHYNIVAGILSRIAISYFSCFISKKYVYVEKLPLISIFLYNLYILQCYNKQCYIEVCVYSHLEWDLNAESLKVVFLWKTATRCSYGDPSVCQLLC